ncbi:hypothetical protein PYW07_015805 [Mythimna separata]|uniref:Gem-associated protein 5 n=1 Tax=Mythimna separata TaxID=271217 RepID=A0AAD7YR53_MYTSE|nr:hypothetical protein PYW07_015805 [Mythimna separata]
MDETILLPSPNWFLPSIMAVTTDGWLIYGGPNKSLCVLEPHKPDVGIIATKEKYQAHVFFVGNSDKVIAVDISPEWLEKKFFLTGLIDGTVKQWSLEAANNRIKIKETHCHDVHKTEHEELIGVGYSNQTTAISVGTSNIVKWDLSSNSTKAYPCFLRGLKATCMACSPHTPLHVAVGTRQGVVMLVDLHGKGRLVYKVRGQDDYVMNLSFCPQYEMLVKKSVKENKTFLEKRLAAIRTEGENETNALEQSGVGKNLPEDSFDDTTVVQEDDMFDIYTDHEHDEFGHKKYEPEDILVKVKKEKADDTDYLAECLKLKEDILKRKNQTEPSIEALVDALDKTHVEGGADAQSVEPDVESDPSQPGSSHTQVENTIECIRVDTSKPDNSSHKQLLASVGKFGGLRIWSETGKLVGLCAIPIPPKSQKSAFVTSVLWYKPDSIIVCDGKNQLLLINPQNVDSKNKLEWQILHQKHKRGLYCVKTNAPRVQTESTVPSDDWTVWSVAQDRNIIRYCVRTRKVLGVHATCGGALYSVVPCPYDAGKVAVSVGDGAVRVLECNTLVEDETRLTRAHVSNYWQNVQGKVLTVAWHPTRENLLAYGTGESRVGLIETGSKYEQPARVLSPALTHGVYALCWGEGMQLYASGGSKLIVYQADQIKEEPEQIGITIEGQSWGICAVSWTPRGLLVGSLNGAVALLTPRRPHTLIATAFVYSKMIHCIEWHPQQTSSSSEESLYRNLIAVTALEKDSTATILQLDTNEADGTQGLTVWKVLSGHTRPVLQTAWNPHLDGLLLTSSQDATVRVWDVFTGTCISIFGGHALLSLGVCWLAAPERPHHVLSGGGEFCLRLWDMYQHKADDFTESGYTLAKKKLRKGKKKINKKNDGDSSAEEQDNLAVTLEVSNKTSKPPKKFMLPIMFKQINDQWKLQAPRKMLQMYLQKTESPGSSPGGKGDGTMNEIVERFDNVDEKGDSTAVEAQKDASTSPTDKEATENTNAQETEDTKDNEDSAQNTKPGKVEKEIDLDYLKIFGSIREVNEFLDMEMDSHLNVYHHPEACIMLLIFRGHIDTMIQFASERDMLCPFLLSMAPCVSFKYWKDATQLYLAQIDRLVARGEEHKLYENRHYGGSRYRKAAICLSMHDVVGAVDALCEGKLFKEAYILCRLRYMDSVAEEIMKKWAAELAFSGQLAVAAVLYIVMGNLSQAAQELAKSHKQDHLSLAAEIAKIAGRATFADQVQKKALSKSLATSEKTEELLKQLPSKIELLMKEKTSNNSESDTLNGDTSKSDTSKSDKLNSDNETSV